MDEVKGMLVVCYGHIGTKSEGREALLVAESMRIYKLGREGHCSINDAYFYPFDRKYVLVAGRVVSNEYLIVDDIKLIGQEEASDEEDEPHEDRPDGPEEVGSDERERLRAVFHPGIDAPGLRADQGERAVNREEDERRDCARKNRFLHDGAFRADTEGADVDRDHKAEVESRDRVHGLIALDEARRKRPLRVRARRCRRVAERMKADPEKENRDETDERRAEELSEELRELCRVERDDVGERKEEDRVDELRKSERAESAERCVEEPRALERRAHHHLEGRARRAGNRKARPDREIDKERKEKGEAGVHSRGERRETSRLRHGHDAENRKADRRHEKARERRGHVGARLRPEKGRKDQVSGSEEHGKKREADEKPLGEAKGGLLEHVVLILFAGMEKRKSRCSFARTVFGRKRG